jgi:hypothetical protein
VVWICQIRTTNRMLIKDYRLDDRFIKYISVSIKDHRIMDFFLRVMDVSNEDY